MKFSLQLLFAFVFTLTACDIHLRQADKPEETGPVKSSLNSKQTQQLNLMLERYYALKDALVADDAGDASTQATELANASNILSELLSTDTVKQDNLSGGLAKIQAESLTLAGIKDESCEYKRIYFERISDALYAVLKDAGFKNRVVYRQYCPMAFNDSGAYWLSSETEIENPYFGKKMRECGEITETIK